VTAGRKAPGLYAAVKKGQAVFDTDEPDRRRNPMAVRMDAGTAPGTPGHLLALPGRSAAARHRDHRLSEAVGGMDDGGQLNLNRGIRQRDRFRGGLLTDSFDS